MTLGYISELFYGVHIWNTSGINVISDHLLDLLLLKIHYTKS